MVKSFVFLSWQKKKSIIESTHLGQLEISDNGNLCGCHVVFHLTWRMNHLNLNINIHSWVNFFPNRRCHLPLLLRPVYLITGELSTFRLAKNREFKKLLWKRQRALHARFKFWHISSPHSAEQQREMTKFKVLRRT